MENEHSHMTRRILNLTLEIIYLLTGEDYTVVKKTSDKHMTLGSDPTVPGHWNSRQSSIMVPLPSSLKPVSNNKKILEVTNNIIKLLTGEVPIRCQDVTVYFSMEEWEYLEEHKDLYGDILMEKRPPLTSADGPRNRNTPEKCPRSLNSQDSTQQPQRILQKRQRIPQAQSCFPQHSKKEDSKAPQDVIDLRHNITYHYQGDNLIVIKVEDDEELSVRADEEDSPVISTDGQYRNFDHPVITIDGETEDDDNICDSPIESRQVLGTFLSAPHSDDLSSDFSAHEVCIIDYLDPDTSSESPTIEKLYPCPQCGKCFTQNSNLVLHQRIHSNTKPYECSACGKSFTQKSHLFTHMRVHTGKKPYPCSLCGKCFRDKTNLLRHGRIHREDKPYSCHVCGRCFKDKSNLSQHHRTHTGEKPYCCFECGKCFTRNSHLNAHQRCHLRAKTLG